MRISHTEAVELLKNDQVIGLPTETVYGLAGRAESPIAIQKIYKLKNRPHQNPLIVHIASLESLQPFLLESIETLPKLASLFWPGPLTLVVPVKPHTIPSMARGGLPTAAFRVPLLESTRNLIRETGPLVAPSANISGKPSATKPEHIENDFGIDFPVLETDEIAAHFGLESTILIYHEGKWVAGRLGAIPLARFESVLGYIPSISNVNAPLCPGQLFRHYAPDAAITLSESGWVESSDDLFDIVVGFPERAYVGAKTVIHWGSESNPDLCAQELYAILRELDMQKEAKVFWDIRFNGSGDWDTILDRLKKASSR